MLVVVDQVRKQVAVRPGYFRDYCHYYDDQDTLSVVVVAALVVVVVVVE